MKYRSEFLDLPFEVSEYKDRMAKTKNAMKKANLDCLLIIGDKRDRGNVRWLSNLSSDWGTTTIVLPLEGEPTVVTGAAGDGEPMHSQMWFTWMEDVRPYLMRDLEGAPKMMSLLKEAINEKKVANGKVGIVGRRLLSYDYLSELMRTFDKMKLEEATAAYTASRVSKSPAELNLMRKLGKIADVGLNATLDNIRPGISEIELVAEAEWAMRMEGSELIDAGMDNRVSAGPRAGFKNTTPTNRKLKQGEMVYVDLTGLLHGYAFDVGRTSCVGKPTPEQESIMETAVVSTEEMQKATRPGVKAYELAEVAMRVAKEMGHADHLMHVIMGHGIGVGHDPPIVNPDSQDVIQEDTLVTYEPMYSTYDTMALSGKAPLHAVAEDFVHVTSNGTERMMSCERRSWQR